MGILSASKNGIRFSIIGFIIGALTCLLYFGLTSHKTPLAGKDCLVIGMCAEYKPFEFKNEKGGIQGFDVDLALEIAKRLGKELVIRDLGFDALIIALKNKELDAIISAMSITNDRLAEIDMVPYHGQAVTKLALVFWGKIPHEITSLQDLESFHEKKGFVGKPVVAVQAGTIQANFIHKVPYVIPRTFDGVSELLLDIQHRKSLAALVRHDLAYQLVKEFPRDVKILDIQLPEKDWVLGDGVGIHKDHTQLTEDIKRIIAQLKEEGFMTWLERKWLAPQTVPAAA